MSLMCQADAVRVGREELVIPSAAVRQGRLPAIGLAASERPIHPYRLLTEVEFARFTPRKFLALTLENEFLRLVVLPELGGRLHRAIYKGAEGSPANYDLFYHNDAIRAELVSARGAWYAGGVEFNFPASHSRTTHTGIEYATRQLDDGSGAIVLANTDLVTRMRWQMAIRIAPGSTAIQFRARLINRTPWPQRFWYWLNAAVPQGPQIRYHFSASKLIGHTQEIDGVATRLDSFPMLRNGSDAREPARLTDTTSVFMLDNSSGFFGYYDLDADLGLVRSAPVRNCPGNKIWSWGDTDYGRRFNQRLVPPGGQYYGELQSGRPESQTDLGVLEPFEVVDCEECWYPIPRLGGMTDGGPEVTLRSEPKAGKVRLVSNREFAALSVRVEKLDVVENPRTAVRGLLTEQVLERVRPGVPVEIAMPPADGPVRVLVCDADGSRSAPARVVLDCRDLASQPETLIPELYAAKALPPPPCTPHALAVRAAAFYRYHELHAAEECCRKALELDGQFGPAHRWLGHLLRLRGRAGEALEHFKAALFSDPMDYAAYYQYAAALAEQGPPGRAAAELERVVGYSQGQVRSWAATLLIRMRLADGRDDQARRAFDERPADVAFGPLGRLAYRLGHSSPTDSPWWDPTTDLFVQVVESADATAALDAWWASNVKPADEAAHAVLDVAEELLEVSDRPRGRAVLAWIVGHPVLGRVCPVAHYHLGELDGDLPAAARSAGQVTDRATMAWPGWLAHETLLERVTAVAGDEPLGHALLGIIRLGLGKPAEAIGPLEAATGLDPSDALSWRNLGLARWTAGRPWEECLAGYRRASALWPDYVQLVVECDRMLRARLAPLEQRKALLSDELHPSLQASEDIATRRADLALATGQFEAGLAQITDKTFYPGEGRFDTHRLFIRLSIRLGERLAGEGDWRAAADLWRKALTFPDNLGIGRPKRVQESRQRYLIATALEHQGDPAGCRAELEALLPICLRNNPVECYFGVLALRKLGREEQAEQWLAFLARQAEERSQLITDEGRHWAAVTRAMLVRAGGSRGQVDASNEILASLNPRPSDDLTDYLVSRIY